MCRVLGVHASGFYAWLKAPERPTAARRARLGKRVRQSWLESGGVYGYRKVHHLLKTERIRRKTYTTRAAARQDIFDYVEMF